MNCEVLYSMIVKKKKNFIDCQVSALHNLICVLFKSFQSKFGKTKYGWNTAYKNTQQGIF